MHTIDIVTEAFGLPRVLWEYRTGGQLDAAVGRWRHEGAQVDLSGGDTFQLVFNVSGGQQVDLRWAGRSVSNVMRAGSLGVVVPDHAPTIAVTGPADIVQIFLSRRFVESFGGAPTSKRPHFDAADPELQAAAVKILVALSLPRANDADELRQILRTVARRFSAVVEQGPAKGGLTPALAARVDGLIDQRLRAMPGSLPAIGELAHSCGLSLHHFIRAFRQLRGQTPHAHMSDRRLDASLPLLLGDARVDETADILGFSSPSHFVSAFRARMGVTPGALRHAAVL